MLMTCMGFAWTGCPPSLHGPALLLVPTVFLPGGLLCPSETHCLVFGGNIFTHPYTVDNGFRVKSCSLSPSSSPPLPPPPPRGGTGLLSQHAEEDDGCDSCSDKEQCYNDYLCCECPPLVQRHTWIVFICQPVLIVTCWNAPGLIL